MKIFDQLISDHWASFDFDGDADSDADWGDAADWGNDWSADGTEATGAVVVVAVVVDDVANVGFSPRLRAS